MPDQGIQACLEHVRGRAPLLTERLLDRLFRDHPHTREVFEQIDQATRQRVVLSALAIMAEFFRHPGQVGDYVRRLGRRHLDYGVRSEDFHAFVDALLSTMPEICGELWTDTVVSAWTQAAHRTKTAMLRAIEQVATGHSTL